MTMTGKKWFRIFIALFLAILLVTGGIVAYIDPFFHYRSPRSFLYYTLYEQRSQNDGITRNFGYDAIITGTSMAENFKASLFDQRFGTDSIKVTYSGATYKEINDNLKRAYESDHRVKYVFRPLDYSLLLRDKDELRLDMGEYPVWLTNQNPFDDVKYLFNRDVIINYTLPVIARFLTGHEGGHTSFDDYSFTGDNNTFSKEAVLNGIINVDYSDEVHAPTEEETLMLKENIEQNVVSLARENPDTTFIYFFPPYSMAYWGVTGLEGNLDKMVYYVQMAVEQMLECDNIHIYNFSLEDSITTDLDNYRDVAHYSPAINDLIINRIADCEFEGADDRGCQRLTKDNTEEYFKELSEYLKGYDYDKLMN